MSRHCGISRSAIRSWQVQPEPLRPYSECPRCSPAPQPLANPETYAYLLGLYLGDGCINRLGRTYALRVACADSWPGLIDACAHAMAAVRPDNSVCRAQQSGCVQVTSYSNHWPCLFPQHGPGRKHERRIVLEGWQQEIVDAYPWELIRGLIHSDGCRVTNWTVRTVGGERKRYEYPRYLFTNKSEDILGICGAALSRAGVEWKVTRRAGAPYNVSVARRAAVGLMDAYVGPKF